MRVDVSAGESLSGGGCDDDMGLDLPPGHGTQGLQGLLPSANGILTLAVRLKD